MAVCTSPSARENLRDGGRFAAGGCVIAHEQLGRVVVGEASPMLGVPGGENVAVDQLMLGAVGARARWT